MKRMLTVALLAISVTCFLSAGEKGMQSSSGNEQEVKKVISQLREAQMKGDTATLETWLADDYTFTNPFGEVMTKSQTISDLKSGSLKFTDLKTENIQTRVYGDTAVATGNSAVKGQKDGQDISGNYRLTWVLVKHQGRWQPVAAQSTRIADDTMMASQKSTTTKTKAKTED